MQEASIKLPVTVLLAVRNEEANLPKCLGSLARAQRVVLLDSQSQDSTAEIAANYRAEIVQFHYSGGYPKKRQWALNQLDITTDWVFLLDADEVVPDSLWREIETAISQPAAPDAFLMTKGFLLSWQAISFWGFFPLCDTAFS